MASKRTQTFNSEEVNSKYEILKQLGTEGIDGVVMKVRCKQSNNIYAMKIFKNIKSSKNIQNEIKFLIKASKINIHCIYAIDSDEFCTSFLDIVL